MPELIRQYGAEAKLTLPNGMAESYGYDIANKVTGISYVKGSTTLGNLAYKCRRPRIRNDL